MSLDDEESESLLPNQSRHQQELSRLLALSDGVFAIAPLVCQPKAPVAAPT
jgi:hypothetical protein